MRNDRKLVTYKQLKKGQEIEGWREGNTTHMACATVESINPAFVTILVFGREHQECNSETTMFEVKLTRQEFEAKYRDGAVEILRSIQETIPEYRLGYHEMWNSWISFDPFDMAAECQSHKIKIIGHCTEIVPKHSWLTDELLDVGICAVDEDGDCFWCHAYQKDLTAMLDRYRYLLKEAHNDQS